MSGGNLKNVKSADSMKLVQRIWNHLSLPSRALTSLNLQGQPRDIPSGFRIDELARVSISLSGLTAALYQSLAAEQPETLVPKVTVDRHKAYLSFFSERLYQLNGKNPSFSSGIGGLHKAKDGYVRIHDGFPHHADGAVKLVGCPPGSDRATVGEAVRKWNALELETAAEHAGLPIYALRTFDQWDATPQAQALPDLPISIHKLNDTPPTAPPPTNAPYPHKCLNGIRVLELSRVIAAPVAGRTLAAHGADVLWLTSPHLPDLPVIDRDAARGKRTIQLDLNHPPDLERLLDLARDADVFIQSYRPGALAKRGLTPETLAAQSRRGGIVVADLSAFGARGPWSRRRGFDSLVQTCSGLNVAEAEFHAEGRGKRCGDPGVLPATAAAPLPCQALDHGAGYMLATGIMAGLCKRATEGGSYHVSVSLAGVGKYLRGLGRYDAAPEDVEGGNPSSVEDIPDELDMVEEHDSGFGRYLHIKHCVEIEGVAVGWDVMPKPLGSDQTVWL